MSGLLPANAFACPAILIAFLIALCAALAFWLAELTLQNDKQKHCLVSCLLSTVCKLGPGGALLVGIVWELIGWTPGDSIEDILADIMGILLSLLGPVGCIGCIWVKW